MTYKAWKDLEHVERYADRRYASWDQRRLDRKEQSAVRGLLSRHGLSGRILDVPSGYGRFLPLLKESGNVVAADLGFYPLLYQKERVGLAWEYINAAAEKLPFKDGSVDVVFCFRLFQHLHVSSQRVAMLREFKRVSRRWVVVSMYRSIFFHRLFRRIVPQPSRITMVSRGRFEDEIGQAELNAVEGLTVVPIFHAQRIYLLRVRK